VAAPRSDCGEVIERATVHVVEHDGSPATAVARAALDDLDFVVTLPRGALVVDSDAALWAYSQYDATVVSAADDDVLAGPVWAVVATDHAIDVDVDLDDDGLLAATAHTDDSVEVRGVRVVVDGVPTAVVLGDPARLQHTHDALRVHAAAHASILEYAPRPLDGGRARVVAPEILQLPFLDPDAAAGLVALADDTDLWGNDPDDPVPGEEVSLAVLSPRLFVRVEEHLDAVVIPALLLHWPEIAWNGVHDAFVIRYTAASAAFGAGLRLHHDVAQISGAVRLNDGYRGGALEFPRQHWTNVAAPVGDLVVWPSLVTHPHASAPVSRGTKYGLTIWLRLPE
jgi:hypothetical protein